MISEHDVHMSKILCSAKMKRGEALAYIYAVQKSRTSTTVFICEGGHARILLVKKLGIARTEHGVGLGLGDVAKMKKIVRWSWAQ